jgi:hypothetical protein
MNSFHIHRVEQSRSNLNRDCLLLPAERDVLSFLLPLSPDYPGIDQWFMAKVVPGFREGTRLLLRVEREGALVGLGIGKNEPDEKKICTVRIAPNFAGRGMGMRIFDGLLKWLDCDRPHLTVNEAKLPLFERIFDYYGFMETSVQEGRYRPESCELGYNEFMTANSECVPTRAPPAQAMTDHRLGAFGKVRPTV